MDYRRRAVLKGRCRAMDLYLTKGPDIPYRIRMGGPIWSTIAELCSHLAPQLHAIKVMGHAAVNRLQRIGLKFHKYKIKRRVRQIQVRIMCHKIELLWYCDGRVLHQIGEIDYVVGTCVGRSREVVRICEAPKNAMRYEGGSAKPILVRLLA